MQGQSVCSKCPVGKQTPNDGNAYSQCNNCYAGSFQPLEGASVCDTCNAGSYTPNDGGAYSQCYNCYDGLYQESNGQVACQQCPAGKYTPATNAPNTYCISCLVNYYASSEKANSCEKCPAGKATAHTAIQIANSACTNCLAGYYKAQADGENCVACEPGKYQTSAGQTFCTSCAAGLYSATTAATTPTVCLQCKAGNYSLSSATSCSICIKGKYTNVSAATTCTLCVGEQAYAPNTGMTTCFQCIDKRQISEPNKTYCFSCNDGEYEDRANGVCLPCPVGTYSDGTTNRKCKACRSGTYAATPKTAVCDKCKACPDSFYRTNCTVSAGGGYCERCPTCTSKEVRVDCMNRAGHNNESGVCRLREFTVRNPYCDLQGAGYFLGGYPFKELFGTSQDNADFQCRGICDGVTNRLTDEMKTERNLALLKNESFDSGYCKGPYACDVPTCVIYGVADDSQPSYRLPAACPVVIDEALSNKLWAVTTQANYKQDPLTVAVQHMRYSVQCQPCSACGEMPTDVLKFWPLMQNYTDWGRGCARECTELSCDLGEIFDWTASDTTAKCKKCADLEDVRLCTSKQQQAFAASDISGNLPKLTFKDCQPKRIVQDGIARATYGDCLKCPETNSACLTPAGLYYATCDIDMNPVCKPCDTRATATSSYFNGTSSNPLYCQKTLCPLDRTGVSVDVLPHRTCHRQCSKARCASERVELPCLLPHDKRCKDAISYADFAVDAMYKKQAYVPAHANVLERVEGLHLYSSFENVLMSVQSIPLQKRRVCVWNAMGITDNDMNPAGISVNFQEACRPWNRDASTSYPLLPLQNTVTDTTDFQRRVLLNTSAVAMHYLSQWQKVVSIPTVFAGDVFLDVELTNTSHVALVAFVSPDRRLSNVTSVVRWHVSVYAQQTIGQPYDVLVRIDTHDDVKHCDECFGMQLACVPPSCSRATTTTNTSLACSSAPHSAFRTSQLVSAWQDFCGDKFHVAVPTGKLYVCDSKMQRRVVKEHTQSHTALSVLTGVLDVSCSKESIFSVAVGITSVLRGATQAPAGKYCLGFLFSNTSVFCLSVLGSLHTVSDSNLHRDAFNIRSVVVFGDSLITTLSIRLTESTISYASNLTTIGTVLQSSATASVLNKGVSVLSHIRYPIFMLATGNPLYFLSRVDTKTETTMKLRKYTCGNIMLMVSTFCESDAVPIELFSGKLPYMDTDNTLLHAMGDTLLLLTSTRPPVGSAAVMAVLVSAGVPTQKSIELTTEAQDIVYPNNGQSNAISGCWISSNVYILAVEDQQQIWRLYLNNSVVFNLLPPVNSMFSYDFIALGSAVLTKTATAYSLTTCMTGCVASTSDKAAYFAFGNETLTYKRLLPCRDPDVTHVNMLESQQAPTKTCAVAEYNMNTYSMQYTLSLKCKEASGVTSISVTLENGAVMRFTGSDTSLVITAKSRQLLYMYAKCVDMTVQYVRVFDRVDCGEGCTLSRVQQAEITGEVRINYALHSVLLPSDSMVYTLLRSSTYAPPSSSVPTSFDRWTQHSTFTHSMTDLQRIQVNVLRNTTALFELSESTHVALDVLQVVPTLNFQAVVYELRTNASSLLTLVHIPSDEDLTRLALLDTVVRGNEVFGWKRLHATAFVRSSIGSDCVYDLRFVAVDDKFIPKQESSKIGCRMRMQTEGVIVVGRCHLEVPFAMANSRGVVGLLLTSSTCMLPAPDSLTVELNPFTSMSECISHQYLDADDAKCVSCETKEVVCGVGFYAAGCEAMLWQSNMVSCTPCPIPPHARFTNASRTCNDWICNAMFFRSDSLCLNCTTDLKTVCGRTKGQMWTPCTDLANEKCVDCPLSLLPRNAEWTNTSECAWKCRPSYFNNNGICESCLSLKILKSVLSIQGTRTPGEFYKFKPCTETRQAEFSTCQFQKKLNVTYTGDATQFLDDCPVRCAQYLHKVNTTVLDAQNTSWQSMQCIECPLTSEPTYLDGSLVPRSGYDMDTSCAATCRSTSDHYTIEGVERKCAYCPAGRCANGQYSVTADGCTSCRNCTSNLQGAFIFQREGVVNDNTSCKEMCAPGYFLTDDGVRCLPHTNVQCVTGQFKVNGTARTDARCDECTDCNGYKQVRACSLTQDAKCESCGPLVWWSSFWNGTDCHLACRSAYTKLYTPKERCQRCSTCPNGYERVSRPANCSDCKACTPPKPQNAEYISQCAWKCEKYHILRLDDETGMPRCVYSVDWATSVPTPPARRQYNVSCGKGQTLTDELLCADCAAPAGLNQSQNNIAWLWTDVGCEWQCMPGLMHVINTTSHQNSCLTRSEYLALVVSRPVINPPAIKSFNYLILLVAILPLTCVLGACAR